jgi:sugar fermentation stimulation protein A
MDEEKKEIDSKGWIEWPELVKGVLVKRYKRFLADVRLDDGQIVTAHCPNTGRMQGCAEPGRAVYLSRHDNPNRKLKYTWQMIKMPDSLVGVNTLVPNRLVFRSVQAGLIPELSGYETVVREVAIGERSRIDLMLSNGKKDRCYVEIKNCTLVEKGMALFPDAVTARGLKHLKALETLVKAGSRGIMFYFIQRMDAGLFKPADSIDPAYGRGLRRAVGRGVEVLAYDVCLDSEGIRLNRKIACEL